MPSAFNENRLYLLSKKIYGLIAFYVGKQGFKENEALKRRVEKSSLCIVSMAIKFIVSDSEEERSRSASRLLHLSGYLYALFDIALELRIIEKKDLVAVESATKELETEIRNV